MILREKKLPEIHFNPQNKSSYLKPTVVDIVDLPSYSKLLKLTVVDIAHVDLPSYSNLSVVHIVDLHSYSNLLVDMVDLPSY